MRFLTCITLGLFLATDLLAQSPRTGVIEGSVLDAAGAPIPNAQVFVVGMDITALADSVGRYRLYRVPAGTVDLRAAFVGYRPRLIRRVEVVAERASVVDHRLEASVVESGCSLDFGQRLEPLVPRDLNTTRWRIESAAPWWVRPYNL